MQQPRDPLNVSDVLGAGARLRMKDLQLVVAIGQHQSLSAAASALGLAQPAASRTLMEIEQALGMHLFHRDRSKGMTPTAAGALLLARAQAILADCGRMLQELEDLRSGAGGHLRLGVIPLAPSHLIEGLVARLTGAEHRMSLTVSEASTTQLLQALQAQSLDAIIARSSPAEAVPGLTRETLFRQEACLLVHEQSALAHSKRVRLSDLRGMRWLLPPAGTPTRVFIDEAFAVAKLAPPRPVVEASTTRVAHLLIRANPDWAGVVPMDTGRDIEAMGGVRALPFPLPLKMPVIGLVYATRHKDTPVIRLLRAGVREVLNQPAGNTRA